ncbi:STAS domain-containing protein [Methylobacterium sp. J-030]|uniref:STAS domain-containing protein n=1 Tax=Methylobacterium sp. J-030 TaxID=2836627 RepID=UPI001FB90C21|nr:STAS domain-containing protein [Methylobacterium sp. J-030]MCJ2072558.1 STAS domain-containing protein [Methylobacterium sp. J-030]
MVEPLTLPMPAECTLRTARAFKEDLSAALDGATVVLLDCAAIEHVDITFVQLVVAAARSSGRRGVTLDLTSPPKAVADAFRRAGFLPHHPFESASDATIGSPAAPAL